MFAALVAGLVVLGVIGGAWRLGGRIEGLTAGALLATVGASPFIESFTLAGELLASLPAVLALLAFVRFLDGRGRAWVAAAGLLAGCAVMVKQSAFDAALAALLYLVWTERRRALAPAALLVGAAAVPVAVGAATAPHLGDWWNAVVAYRFRGDSLVTGSADHRLHLLLSSLPAAAKGLGLLALLAAIGWRRAPLLARLWLACAALGVLGGGNFHPHYYLQLAPPLALLGGFGVAALVASRPRALTALCGAAAAATVALTAPLWLDSTAAQARTIWPHDPHLLRDADIAAYVRAHTRPDQRILVVWASADVYYLADRPPALPYLWQRNVEALPGALARARRLLAERKPALVIVAQRPSAVDRTGVTARLLGTLYRRVGTVDGTPILRPAGP